MRPFYAHQRIHISMKIKKFTTKSVSFSYVKKVCFVYKLTQKPMTGVFQRDQLTCDVFGNPIHSGNR